MCPNKPYIEFLKVVKDSEFVKWSSVFQHVTVFTNKGTMLLVIGNKVRR